MALTPAQRAELIDLLVQNVPARTFIDIVHEQSVMADLELVRRQAPEDPTEARRFVASAVVDAYDAVDRIPQLARAVYRRTYLDDRFAPKIYPYVAIGEAGDNGAKEAALVKRANTMSSRALREFLDKNEAKICIVVAVNNADPRRPRFGTGFLVGPDTVLTAYHTLEDHIHQGKARLPDPGRRSAVFDFYEGDPLESLDSLPASAVAVPFAEDWLIDSRPDMPNDGRFRQPDAEQRAKLAECLDFALVRLAEPIGKQARRHSGGARRSWLKLSAALGALAQDDRIIIPQHPNGYPQRIDFGRFSQADSELDSSLTRLRYDTETDKGTSGAPCFNQNFTIVGMHNAAFQPDGINVEKNQAVRIDRILAVIKPIPGDADAEPAPVRVWNASTAAEPRVILGRDTFIEWLGRACVEVSGAPKDRVYAASLKQEDLANSHSFGKTFTIEILQAHRRGCAEPIVLLGTPEEPLPESVPDIVRTIGFQLGMDSGVLATMPQRPSADLPANVQNADKLRLWASKELPEWFDAVLGRFREETIDKVAEARKRVEALRGLGQPPSPEDLALSQQAEPAHEARVRWPVAWIVVSNLLNHRLPEEVRDFLAGMVGGKLTEVSMPQQLRRLRWMFVGYVPDFLASDRVTAEVLDPREIGAPEVIAGITQLADSRAFTVNQEGLELATAIVDVALDPAEGVPAALDPTRRLPYFQQTMFPKLRTRIDQYLRRS